DQVGLELLTSSDPPALASQNAGIIEHSQLLLTSFSGFRWDYDQDVDTPNLDCLTHEGVKTKYLVLPFVTVTSPSHFTAIPESFQPSSLRPAWAISRDLISKKIQKLAGLSGAHL
uniref:Uncharacterized protein n=1 Tax=Theropithecus gelada TaxID=9565 RepID=A0A8D2EVH7_THEGE